MHIERTKFYIYYLFSSNFIRFLQYTLTRREIETDHPTSDLIHPRAICGCGNWTVARTDASVNLDGWIRKFLQDSVASLCCVCPSKKKTAQEITKKLQVEGHLIIKYNSIKKPLRPQASGFRLSIQSSENPVVRVRYMKRNFIYPFIYPSIQFYPSIQLLQYSRAKYCSHIQG